MTPERAVNLNDLRRMAKRRLPGIVYDFIEGGADDELALGRALNSFGEWQILPRYLVDVTQTRQVTTLFGREYASPIGISPTGLAALVRHGADMMLAGAARDNNIPFIMSSMASGSIEQLAKVAPEHGWYQLYPARNWHISQAMVLRVRDAGLSTLVLSVDVPCASNRERDLRNGFQSPDGIPLRTKLEALLHPRWLLSYFRHGTPMFSNWMPYTTSGASSAQVAQFVGSQSCPPLTWRDVEKLRQLWPGNLVLKGIMHPEDAIRAVEHGVDGIIISNHGGRQLDRSPTTLEALPGIHAAVGEQITLMLDGGVRRGSDVVIARCLGAKHVFLGRPMLWGLAAAGRSGVDRTIAILMREIDIVMRLMGCVSTSALAKECLTRSDDYLR